jgi:beta-lactamase superfamily II metal-dependent hydrolase
MVRGGTGGIKDMGYEIDFLPVGQESSGGDAIALRYGNLYGTRDEQTVIVIDGGYAEDGEALVGHINKHYGTNRVDIVVSTHPDQDHISGLKVVLEKMVVGQLWMHQPWLHSPTVADIKASAFNTVKITNKLQAALKGADELASVAVQYGVPIIEPFAEWKTADGVFRILGPSPIYYEELLGEMIEASQRKVQATNLLAELFKAQGVSNATKLVAETLYEETLLDAGETTPRNNSSAVCLLTVDERQNLFTGDAGIPALEKVVDVLENEGYTPGQLRFIQVPHHGSKRNVGPSVLDRLLGPKGQAERSLTAFVSVPRKNPEGKHPAKKVLNAFHRRGYNVHETKGSKKWYYHLAPDRSEYSPSTPASFHDLVEDDGTA